jgi:hypothetical protein
VGAEHGLADGTGDDGEAEDVIGVLVGDEDGVDGFEAFPDGGQAGGGLLAAQPGVNENAGFLRSDEDGVARTRGCQNAELENNGLALL